MSRERGAVVLATVILLNAGGGGKPVETRTISFAPPADTILTNYVNVPMAAWLGGTTWAVVAGEFNEAAIVDFTSRTVRKLGTRQVEIRNPFGVYAAGDTAWVTDWGASGQFCPSKTIAKLVGSTGLGPSFARGELRTSQIFCRP